MRNEAPLAQQVAAAIEADIEADGWQTGTILGSESDLCERYAVSRAIIREAVRLLESKKIARMKAGRGGGLLICEPDVDMVVTSTALLLRRTGVQLEELVEAHRAVAVASAGLAAARIDETTAARLRQFLLLRDTDMTLTPAELRNAAMAFHMEIASAAKNAVLGIFTEMLVELTHQRVALPDPATWPAVRHAHRRTLEALIAGDVELAQRRMHRHFEGIADAWFAT